MKMKNEEEKNEIFSNLPNFSEAFNFADFIQIFQIFIRSKVTSLQSTQKWQKTGKNRQNGPTLGAVAIDRRKI